MKFLWLAIVALLVQVNTYAQVTNEFPQDGNVGIGTVNPAGKLHVLSNNRNYYVNRAIPGITEDQQGLNYFLLHEAYTGTLSPDRHVMGKITAVRGNTISYNRKWTVEVNTASAYNSNTGSLIAYNEPARLVMLVYNTKTYLAVEIANRATIVYFSFTGYAMNEAFQVVKDDDVSNVTEFAASAISMPGSLSVGTGSAAARLEVGGGPVWTVNNWQKSVRIQPGGAIEFGGTGKSYGMGTSGSNLYFFNANINGSGAANYIMMYDGIKGNLGIGTSAPPAEFKLAVNGAIGARKVKVTQAAWADFVFHKDYQLPSLREVETFVQQNKHLPGIPSEAEVLKDGLDVGEMNKLLLQKVEELTLYIIDLKKESQRQQEKIEQLEKRLE